ncbi:MAG TPA: protein phosphatase 2C domain-containing protein [Parvibaculum sp.]|jgi:protein phosphatase
MKFDFATFSHQGPKGPNQDAVMVPVEIGTTWWTAIADGIGGQPGGDVASTSAIQAIKEAIQRNAQENMKEVFRYAVSILQAAAEKNPSLASMGTTLTVLKISDNKGEVGHVGDTRIYHLRDDGLLDRTEDQTEVRRLLKEGVLNRVTARRYPRRHVLLSALSPTGTFDLQTTTFEIALGDRIILITDGVYEKILRREVRDISRKCKSAVEVAIALEETIMERVPSDDFSAVVIEAR